MRVERRRKSTSLHVLGLTTAATTAKVMAPAMKRLTLRLNSSVPRKRRSVSQKEEKRPCSEVRAATVLCDTLLLTALVTGAACPTC